MRTWLIASITTACVTYTLTSSPLFEKPRDWATQKSHDRQARYAVRLVMFAVTCAYCLNHWVALVTLGLITRDVSQTALWLFPTVWVATHLLGFNSMIGPTISLLQMSVAAKDRGLRPQQQSKAS